MVDQVQFQSQEKAEPLLHEGANPASPSAEDQKTTQVAQENFVRPLVVPCMKVRINSWIFYPRQMSELLLTSAELGDLENAKQALYYSAYVDIQDDNQNTPLHIAALNNNDLMGELLLSKNADSSIKNQKGNTPLHVAIAHQRKDMAKLLVDAFANLNAKNKQGQTPLHLAIERKSQDLAELLIKSGAKVDRQNKQGQTPLHLAIERKSQDLAELLIKSGAKVDVQNKQGQTPFYLAIKQGDENLAKFLLERGANSSFETSSGKSLLSLVATKGNSSMVKLLVQHGADINFGGSKYPTPLYSFIDHGHQDSDLENFFIENGADLNAAPELGYNTLFHLAISKQRVDLALRCIENGVNVDQQNSYETPLHYIATRDHMLNDEDVKKIVERLLDRGAFVDAKDGYGETPLHEAARNGDKKLVQLLLDRGAFVDAKDRYGKTPLHQAARSGDKKLVQLLLDRGAFVDAKDEEGHTPLIEAAIREEKELVELLLNNGSDVNQKIVKINNSKEKQETPLLIYLISEKNIIKKEILYLLLDKGADANQVASVFIAGNKYAKVPLLHVAIFLRDKDIVKILLDKGADVNQVIQYENGKKTIPLHLAIKEKNKDIVKILLAKGADVHIRDEQNEAAFDVAFQTGDQEIIELIRKEIQKKKAQKNSPKKDAAQQVVQDQNAPVSANKPQT